MRGQNQIERETIQISGVVNFSERKRLQRIFSFAGESKQKLPEGQCSHLPFLWLRL